MSTIYIGKRQSGKTTMLIEISEKTGATIVVATYPMAKYIVGSSGARLSTQVLFVEVILADKTGRFLELLNSKTAFVVLVRLLSNSVMRRTRYFVRWQSTMRH